MFTAAAIKSGATYLSQHLFATTRKTKWFRGDGWALEQKCSTSRGELLDPGMMHSRRCARTDGTFHFTAVTVSRTLCLMPRVLNASLRRLRRSQTSADVARARVNAAEVVPQLFAVRAAAKASARAQTARQLAAGELTPAQAQFRNAPIETPVRMVNMWSAINRHTAAR